MKELVKRMKIWVSGLEFWFTIQEKLRNQGTGKGTVLGEEILYKTEVTGLNDWLDICLIKERERITPRFLAQVIVVSFTETGTVA